jgi:hypothetical protein
MMATHTLTPSSNDPSLTALPSRYEDSSEAPEDATDTEENREKEEHRCENLELKYCLQTKFFFYFVMLSSRHPFQNQI